MQSFTVDEADTLWEIFHRLGQEERISGDPLMAIFYEDHRRNCSVLKYRAGGIVRDVR
jgi:hypothetical protein